MPGKSRKKTPPGTPDAYFAKLKGPPGLAARALRGIIRSSLPDAEEVVRWGMPCYSRRGMVCYLLASRSAVTLGFYRGVGLTDPSGLLRGGGKKLRHVKVASAREIRKRQFGAWIRQAAALNG